MNHLEGGSKDCYKYAYYKLWDNCGSPACFSVGDSCSFSCLHLGKSWCSFFGQKDSGFKSIILDNMKGLAEKKIKKTKKKKKTNCLHDHKSLSKTLSDAPRYIRHTFRRKVTSSKKQRPGRAS